jgi:phenylalanine-4-hydroxylase
VHDEDYRARRAAIASQAAMHIAGGPIADVEYTAEEDHVWAVVSSELAVKHRRLACREVVEASERLALPRQRVPQLREVDAAVSALSGFHLEPVPGLVPTRRFYGSLADRIFLATQYLRHHSVPFYTPEPDIVHEIIGHATMLASPVLAELHHAAGWAARRAETDAALEFFSRVFWFTLEFGVAWEGDELRTYGAGLLSSYGEIDVFRDAELRPFDLKAMGTQSYDITTYQPVLFAAPSFAEMVDVLGAFFDTYDDEVHLRLTR